MIHGMDSSKPKPKPVNTEGTQDVMTSSPTPNQITPLNGSTNINDRQINSTPVVKHGLSFRVLQWLTDTDKTDGESVHDTCIDKTKMAEQVKTPNQNSSCSLDLALLAQGK